MDTNRLIIRGAQAAAEHDLANVHALAAAHWQEQGYTVIAHEGGYAVVGKNAATGEDNPAALTIEWDTIKELGGEYWFFSPANDPRFTEYRQRGIDLGMTWECEEIEMPEEWNENF